MARLHIGKKGWIASIAAVLILVTIFHNASLRELMTSQSYGLGSDRAFLHWPQAAIPTPSPAASVLPDVLYELDHTPEPTHASLPPTSYESTPLFPPLKTDSRFIAWLSARVPGDRVPFITIGDYQYVHALRNFRHRLDQWEYGQDLVVICLDRLCMDARGFHAYPGYIGESVAFVKVRYSGHFRNVADYG